MHSDVKRKTNKPSALGARTKVKLWVTTMLILSSYSSSSPTAKQQSKNGLSLLNHMPLKGVEWILISSGVVSSAHRGLSVGLRGFEKLRPLKSTQAHKSCNALWVYLSLGLTVQACEHSHPRSTATSTLVPLLCLDEWLTIRAFQQQGR